MTNKSLIIKWWIRHFVVIGKAQIKDDELLAAIVKGLKALRLKKGITQEDFFNDTGIHISRIETGKVNVSISTLKAIVGYFDISLALFFQAIECWMFLIVDLRKIKLSHKPQILFIILIPY